MGWLRSAPLESIPWRDTLLAGVGAVLIPSLIGFAALGVSQLAAAAPIVQARALLLGLSPLMSGAGLILLVPLAGILLRQGWFGWVVAVALGFGVVALIEAVVHYPGAAPFGAAVGLIMRAILGRMGTTG